MNNNNTKITNKNNNISTVLSNSNSKKKTIRVYPVMTYSSYIRVIWGGFRVLWGGLGCFNGPGGTTLVVRLVVWA